MNSSSVEADALIGPHKGQTRRSELKISEGVVLPRLSQPPRCDNYMRRSAVEAHFHPGVYRLEQRVSGEVATNTIVTQP